MDFDPYSNNNVVAKMRKMSYFPRMNLGKIVKEAVVQVLTIPTVTPPFRLGYKPMDDDLLEIKVRRMACAKAKAKGLPCPFRAFGALHSHIEQKVCQSWRYSALLGIP